MENLKKPSIFKRLGAMVFDILVWFLLSLFLLLVAIDPLVNVVTKYNDKKYEYNMGLFDAYAVVYAEYKEENNDFSYELVYDASSKKEDIEIMKDELLNGSKNKRYLVSIVTSKLNIDVDYYLTNFYEKIDNLDVYLEAKTNEKELFGEDGKVLSEAKVESLSSFYSDMYSKALNSEKFKTYQEGKFYNMALDINKIDTIKAYGAYLISLSVVYFVIPLISKRRQTLGKMVMKIMVVGTKTDKVASIPQLLVRFAALASIEFLAGMLMSFMLYLPLLVSIILMVVTINQSAIHDFIAKTKVVEVPYVNPYLQRPIEEENGKEEEIVDVDVEEIEK